MESMLFPVVLESDKPMLGICRGIQFLNAVLGGMLYQDWSAQYILDIEHHQAIKSLSVRLKAMVVFEDGLSEAVYMPDWKFV